MKEIVISKRKSFKETVSSILASTPHLAEIERQHNVAGSFGNFD